VTIATQRDLDEYRRLGRLEAEAFDRRLREHEHQAWENRLATVQWGAEDGVETWSSPREDSPEVWLLRRDVERLASFHEAVLKSRPWQLIQALRRVVGRAW
jgi:hypothetical protein